MSACLRDTAFPAGWFGQDVACVCGDIADPSAYCNAATDGTDIVFHLAAKLHINDPSPQWEAEYRRVNVKGTSRLAEAARARRHAAAGRV